MQTLLTKIKNYPKMGLLLLAYIAFIALGMPDGLLGVAWPTVREGFSIPLDALGSLLVVTTTGYLISSFLSGKVIARLGVGKVLMFSCMMTGVALIGYTLVPVWWMFVALGILAGLGAGAIDAGLNTYVASHFGEGLMQWLHASYGIGVTSGPFIMTYALNTLNSWRVGYFIVGGFQLVLAITFAFTLRMWTNDKAIDDDQKPKLLTDYKTPLRETLSQKATWMSIFQFLLYTGSEVGMGTWTYTLLTQSRGVDPEIAGFWTGSYWAMFTIGRVIAGLFAKKVGVNKLVLSSLIGAFFGAVLLWWNPLPIINVFGVGIIGLMFAPIFPGLVSGTSQRVGAQHAANTIGIQMSAAALGTATIPSLMGVLARRISLEVIPVILVVLFSIQILLYLTSSRNGKKLEAY